MVSSARFAGVFRFLAQLPDALTPENLPHQTTSLKRLSWSVQLHGRTQRMLDKASRPLPFHGGRTARRPSLPGGRSRGTRDPAIPPIYTAIHSSPLLYNSTRLKNSPDSPDGPSSRGRTARRPSLPGGRRSEGVRSFVAGWDRRDHRATAHGGAPRLARALHNGGRWKSRKETKT